MAKNAKLDKTVAKGLAIFTVGLMVYGWIVIQLNTSLLPLDNELATLGYILTGTGAIIIVKGIIRLPSSYIPYNVAIIGFVMVIVSVSAANIYTFKHNIRVYSGGNAFAAVFKLYELNSPIAPFVLSIFAVGYIVVIGSLAVEAIRRLTE